jgi:glucose-6-phosphate isomerase
VLELLDRLAADAVASRIWQRETSLFARAGAETGVHDAIRNRLGWLDAPEAGVAHVAPLSAFAAEAHRAGLSDVYLLGMGGSSLCAEALRDIGAAGRAECRLTVIDTTDEHTVRQITSALKPARSLFIVASKSGSTIEVDSLERHFWAEMTAHLGAAAAAQFVAITDPGTALEKLGAEKHYRRVFVNPPDIGGRYSVLSLFGLVPAALVGVDLAALVESSRRMATACHADGDGNPGLALGAFMAENAIAGRDKLTLLIPDSWRSLGAWVEQLVAESTGKNGHGVLPVVGEPLGSADEYRDDRAIVATITPGAAAVETLARALEAAGRPVFRLMTSGADLGAEFFRWEFATAVAGAGIGVNSFDEPNVREAKVRTQAQLDTRRKSGRFHLEPALERRAGYLRRSSSSTAAPESGRYLAILDYLPADPGRAARIHRFRGELRSRNHAVTTYGVGPRYLHSTGQYHKGGPNTGRFLLLTADDSSETAVPGTDYTFSALKQAQALGDFDALVAAGRDVVHCHFDDASADVLKALEENV